ncbi:hypothetical protein FACS189440_09220 [Bacteroidia bacterium]|nr:hypothetical protein FACS189440_09220 [Bacteroidia bacterium]
MKKYLIAIFSVVLLFASCTDEDNLINPPLLPDGGIYPRDIEVLALSDVVPFTAPVVGATNAKVSLVTGDATTVLRESLPVSATVGGISEQFTTNELGLKKAGDKATLKIEANGYTRLSTISMLSAWNEPEQSDGFTTLEASLLSNSLTFSVNTDEWITGTPQFTAVVDTNNVAYPNLLTFKAAGKEFTTDDFSVAYLQSKGLHVGNTVAIIVTASYNGHSEEIKTSFTLSEDVLTRSSGKELTEDSWLSTTTAPWTSADSTKTFYGLLDGKEFKGLETALKQDDIKQPTVFFTLNSTKDDALLQILSSTATTVSYAVTDSAHYEINNRIVTEANAATESFTPFTDGLVSGYYFVKVEENFTDGTEYYGYLYVETVFTETPIFGNQPTGVKYTFKFAPKRDYTKE